MLEYKGYHAKIEYSADDELFIGEVFGIKDTFAFSGVSVEELKESFHTVIDEYIDWCGELKVEPDKEFKGSFNVRINPELHRRAAMNASMRGVSLNQYVSNAIENYSKDCEAKN
jgi:predicted HicB family RNase H-like nuclease